MSVVPLPLYASTSARKDMTPSQVATLNETISTSLNQCLALPANKFDIPSGVNFVRTYTKDVAARILQNLIWNTSTQDGDQLNLSLVERSIHRRTLLLAERLASSLDFQVIVDLAVTYGSSSPRRIRTLFSSAFSENSSLGSQVTSQGLPALTSLLSSTEQGLYGLRKMSHIILSVVRSAPKELLHSFAHNKEIIVALAKAYDHGLFSIAQSYGGFRFTLSGSNIQSYAVEDWERIFLETKVALIDSFHLILRSLLSDIAAISSAGPALAAECEQAFDTIFALLELPSSSQSTPNQPPTPFLNQSLLSDYQHSYDLSRTLSSILKRASDPRTELLESTLRSLDTPSENGSAGALTLIIRSSGIPPGIDHKGKGVSQTYTDKKGKGKATDVEVAQVKTNPALDKAVTQVLDILPEQPPDYIYYLLSHPDYPYKGNPERLVEALLEGTAPAPEEVEHAIAWQSSGGEAGIVSEGGGPAAASIPKDEEFQYTKHRLNVFDDQKMDLSQVRIGKKNDVSSVVIQDRAFIDQMKADILRRAEEASYSDEEDEDEYNPYGGDNKDKSKGKDVAFEDELDEDGRFKVRDGEGSEDDEDDSDSGGEGFDGDAAEGSGPKGPETTLELAYIRDPGLFDRDAHTRRSKARADLKAQTGWSDEQIEGWRIMLERNPKKDKILQKHEFSGNRPGLVEQPSGPSQQPSRGGGRGGRGRGGGGGRGRGRGGRGGHGSEGGSGGGDGGSARDRAWKDKHKSSRGNHNRKSGHDKKMAKAGGPS